VIIIAVPDIPGMSAAVIPAAVFITILILFLASTLSVSSLFVLFVVVLFFSRELLPGRLFPYS